MSAPIFDDPEQHGAADPTVIRNEATGEWWMFYTNRRAHLDSAGPAWIHGCPIGVAISDDGVSWRYRGTVAGLDDPADTGLNTHWAPEVIRARGEYHMYLTYIPGAPDTFANRYRHIYHFTSPDLETWTRRGALDLGFDNVIDAAVFHCPDGLYRLWYKSEPDGSSTWAAVSPDLYEWTREGRVIPGKPDGAPHEGPNVFELGGHIWMIVDEWRGQGVYRSNDAKAWTRQGLILDAPGAHPNDRCFARHADVVVSGNEAALFYFTHPDWDEAAKSEPETPAERRTTIHVARVWVEDGVLKADRDVDGVPLA